VTPEPTEPTALIDEPVPGSAPPDAAVDAPANAPAKPEAAWDGAGDGTGESDHTNDAADGPGPKVVSPNAKRQRWLREAVVVLVFAFLVAIVLRTFVVQTFYIPTGSMEPTLQVGDRILVNKLSYHLHGVHRGDIVVFNRPKAENCGGPAVNDLVKRVIGLPGETISIAGSTVDINGKRLDETWLPASKQRTTRPGPDGTASNLSVPYKIPANNYFVMGDNRGNSCDSRYWGPIPGSLIVGKVELRVWPLSSLHLF
jgi:signal peptidase I